MILRDRIRTVLRKRGALADEAIATALQVPLADVQVALWQMRREGQIARHQTYELIREPKGRS